MYLEEQNNAGLCSVSISDLRISDIVLELQIWYRTAKIIHRTFLSSSMPWSIITMFLACLKRPDDRRPGASTNFVP